MPSSVQLYNQAIADFKNIQDKLFEKQAKIGADSKADTFAELGSDIDVVVSYRFSAGRSDKYVSSIDEVTRKVDTAYRAVDDIIKTAIDFKSTLSLEATSTNANVNDLTGAANAVLDKVRGALNSKDGSVYVFSGSNTDTLPVDDLKLTSNVLDSNSTAIYYNGDDVTLGVEVSSTLTVEYGVKASDPAFKKLIGAINKAKDQEARGSSANYQAAANELSEAIDELISLQADMGNNIKIMEQMKSFHEKAKDTFEQKLAEANSPDIVQLTIETSQLQASLQASFMIFSRISDLNLSNFLN